MYKKALAVAIMAMSGTVFASDLVLLSTVSRKVHGNAAVFDIPLVANEGFTEPLGVVEPRSGPYHHIVFTWNMNITDAECQNVMSGASTGYAIIQGSNVICPVYSPYNGIWALVNVIVEAHGNRFGEAITKVGYLQGDVDGDYQVTTTDKALVNSQVARVVTVNNFKYDVNANGYLTVSDVGITNARIGTYLPE